jgi:hypothetical protein
LAIKWFKLAADQGLPEAQENLDLFTVKEMVAPLISKKLRTGINLPQNKVQALLFTVLQPCMSEQLVLIRVLKKPLKCTGAQQKRLCTISK